MLVQNHADDDAKAIGNDHAQCSACQYGEQLAELGCNGDCCQLGLIAHFSDEKRDGNGPEGIEAVLFILAIQFIAAQCP